MYKTVIIHLLQIGHNIANIPLKRFL